MLDVVIFGCFAAFAVVLAFYSFLEQHSWINVIAASLVSSITLWVETLLFASGNVGFRENVIDTVISIGNETTANITTNYTYTELWAPITEQGLVFLFILFSVFMTIYTIMTILIWLQERAAGVDSEVDEDE